MVRDCMDEIRKARRNYHIRLQWVKGHSDETGNELADALAKEGTTLLADPDHPKPLTWVKGIVRKIEAEKMEKRLGR
jgi:ribonuclease HI